MKKPHGNTGRPRPDLEKGEKSLKGRTAFRLPAELKSRAEAAAKAQGLSASQLYVLAIQLYLE